MSSSTRSSESATHMRRRPPPTPTANNPITSEPDRQLVVPAPIPRPVFQLLGFVFLIFLVLLQFLPATHFRHPADPLRNWTPFDGHEYDSSSSTTTTLSQSGASSDGNSSFITTNGGDDGMIHIVSWMDCLDLRLLAVLANSTLSSSRYQDRVFFHFFIPKGNEDKVSYFKLKVLFPHANLEIHGQEEVKERIRNANSGIQFAGTRLEEVAPFIIPSVYQLSFSKFIYISPNVLMKGRVEELIGIDLGNYAIGAAEDCSKSKRLNMFVKSDVLDAIQRSASNPWVSETPYMKNACMPDLSVLLIDAKKLGGDFVEAFLWWSNVLNWHESNQNNPAIVLALYNRYLKLSSSWLVRDSTSSKMINRSMVINYDGPKKVCSEFGNGAGPQLDHGNIWTQYLPPMSDQILGT